jgi:methyl-accepting chemotaxis protein
MALSVPPAPRARARAARSMFSDRRTGRKLLTAFVLARTSLLVLTGRASVNAACGGHDRHRVEHRCKVGRRLDVVLAGSTDAVTGQRCFLVIGQDDDLAAFIAARKAATDDVDTASTLTDDAPLQQQRMPWLCPPVQQACTVAQGAVDRSGAPGRQAFPTVLPQKESTAVRDHIGSLDSLLQAEEGRLLGVRRAGSAPATQPMSSTLVVAGLIGLLGVCGAAASIVHSVTGPVRRAVRVLQAPEKGRRGHRLRPTTLHELQNMSRAVDTAGDDPLGAAREIGADARSLSMASEGPTATSGPPSSSAEEFPTPAGVVSTDAEQVPAVLAVPAGIREIAPDMTEAGQVVARTVADVGTTRPVTRRHESLPETRSAVKVIASVVQQAQLVALDATIESARSGGADTGFAVIAPRGEEPAEEAAKAAEAVTAASTPAASSVATTRYAAARSRALGPTTALWHAVELDRLVGAIGGACETTVCGSLVRVSTERRWPVPARDVCPACSTLAH